MRFFRLFLALGIALFASQGQALQELSVDGPLTARHFARFSSYQSVDMSPDGRYLAVSARLDGQAALLFLGLPNKNVVYGMRFQDDRVAGQVNWVSNERVVVSLAYQEGAADAPSFTGELLGINANGSGMRYLFGSTAVKSMGTRLGGYEPEGGFAYFEAPLRDDPEYALIRVLKTTVRTAAGRYYDESYTSLSRINLLTGKRTEVASAPMRDVSRYFTDTRGRVFMVSGVGDDSYKLKTFWRPGDGDWQLLPFKATVLRPIKLSSDGQRAYFDAEYDSGRECLLEWTLPTTATAPAAAPREVICKPDAFLGTVYFTADDRPYGYNGGEEKGVILIDTKPPEAQALAALQAQFKDQLVYPADWTHKHDKLIYHVYSDRNSGEYYLFDLATQEATFFDASQIWLDPERMARVRLISYPARDGLTIDGYLTLPPGRGDKNLPMVVMPHGGPIGVRDRWEWNDDAQFLASRGYAVLQMNYRGSSNHGDAFEKMGFGEWGGKMIDDITDGARWAVAQGVADGKRLCIYGASYGGYAALMSAVREPDLYRCAVGYAGVYDLNLLYAEGFGSKNASGRLFWEDAMGKTPELRAQQSPLAYISKLKAAVMIVHGEDDIITPLSQAKVLRKALDAQKIPYEWLVKAREGHGFVNEDNRVELYEKLAAFMDKNIGKQ